MNESPVDHWTLAHIGVGIVAGSVGVGFVPWLALGIAYEVAEHHVEKTEWGQRAFSSDGPETIANATVDVLANTVGWWLGTARRPALRRWAERA